MVHRGITFFYIAVNLPQPVPAPWY